MPRSISTCSSGSRAEWNYNSSHARHRYCPNMPEPLGGLFTREGDGFGRWGLLSQPQIGAWAQR